MKYQHRLPEALPLSHNALKLLVAVGMVGFALMDLLGTLQRVAGLIEHLAHGPFADAVALVP